MDTPQLAQAREQLARITGMLDEMGLRHIDIEESSFGVGVGVAWAETDFVVISVSTGSPHIAYISVGILKDINQNRLVALNAVNNHVSNNPEFPFYLHDADLGWDIIMQQAFPIQVLADVPRYFHSRLEPATGVAADARTEMAANLGGSTYRFEPSDVSRLLLRSLL